MDSLRAPRMTSELLRSYSEAALRNAEELLAEASILHGHGHYARGYFLAVASIEEAGKALLAFDSQKRNLSDPAVCTRLKSAMESHAQKINYALGVWAYSSRDQREALNVALDLIVDLKHGREPSMYTDLRADPDRIQSPQEVVREYAARDCIRLAENSLSYANRHIREKTPPKTTVAQDRLFTMKSAKLREMMNTEDFWWFYLSCMESGQPDIAEAVIRYERDYASTGARYRSGE